MKKYDLVCTITGVSGFVGSNLARALLLDACIRADVDCGRKP